MSSQTIVILFLFILALGGLIVVLTAREKKKHKK